MQLPVAFHAHAGGHIVAFQLTDQRVQHDPRVVTFGGQSLGPSDERVLVRPVQRVSGLESQRSIPFLVLNEGSNSLRREHVLAVLGIRRLREDSELTPQELAARVLLGDASPGMIETIGPIDLLDIEVLVPRVAGRVVNDRDDRPFFGRDRGGAGLLDRSGFVVGDRERDRNRPGVGLASALDHALLEHTVPHLFGHGTGQGRKRTVADAVERREIGLGHGDRRQLGRLSQECLTLGETHRPIDGGVEATVNGNEMALGSLLHGNFLSGVRLGLRRVVPTRREEGHRPGRGEGGRHHH